LILTPLSGTQRIPFACFPRPIPAIICTQGPDGYKRMGDAVPLTLLVK